jgi:ABC-2 type transport system ATP-binding protein
MTTTATEATTAHAAVVSFDQVSKAYGDVCAVDGLTLDLHPGETVALLGPNGAGKSTTLDLLLGLRTADSGTVRLFGASPQEAIARGRVGAMLQTGGLMEDVTVEEIVRLVCDLHPRPYPVGDVLARAGIASIADRMVNKLSGGQEQRVRFALATAGANDLIVLDEPTTGMDVTARQAFWATMREQAEQGRTVLFATHYLDEADAFADRVVVLANGLIVADGTGAQIKASVAGRTISAVIPGVGSDEVAGLPGVVSAEPQASRILLHCNDSDTALRAMLAGFPAAHDIEIAAGNLEDAFLELTAASRQESNR